MLFFKNTDKDGVITRLDAADNNVSGGEEISTVEYKCMQVALQVFYNGKDPTSLTAKDWGAEHLE